MLDFLLQLLIHVSFCCFCYGSSISRIETGAGSSTFYSCGSKIVQSSSINIQMTQLSKMLRKITGLCKRRTPITILTSPEKFKGSEVIHSCPYPQLIAFSRAHNHLNCNSKLYAQWFAAITELLWKRGWAGCLSLNMSKTARMIWKAGE